MTPYYADAAVTLYQGDALNVLRELPAASVQCVVTSPPYWSLRDYGIDGQLGLEDSPQAYVAALVAVFDEVRRVLRSDGVSWLNLGDSYQTGGGLQSNDARDNGTFNVGRADDIRPAPAVGLKPKDLVGIPWRVAFALQDAGWWLRSDVIWSKPNPMPESVTDRPTKSHEYVFLLTKSSRYYYDADAIREPHTALGRPPGNKSRIYFDRDPNHNHSEKRRPEQAKSFHEVGRNRRTVWEVATHPYPGAHFATFPPKLIEPMVKAGTSERGCCPECGAPWVRVVEREKVVESTSPRYAGVSMRNDAGDAISHHRHTTTGWQPSCTCDAGDPIPCTVLDPFVGSGTTSLVAQKLGRRSIGVDLNPAYLDLAVRRCQQKTLWFLGAYDSSGKDQ